MAFLSNEEKPSKLGALIITNRLKNNDVLHPSVVKTC